MATIKERLIKIGNESFGGWVSTENSNKVKKDNQKEEAKPAVKALLPIKI